MTPTRLLMKRGQKKIPFTWNPRHVKVEIIPSGKKTRAQTDELFDNFAKKMMKFPKSTGFALPKQYKYACGMGGSKCVKLSKSNIRNNC